jgi:methyl-accepting chemotaxis protein
VDGLEKIAKPFDRETQLVSRQVDRMYVGFQYQDRISQMMALLHTDMQRLNDAIADDKTAPDALGSAFWLSRLESQYAMAEQRQDHRGGLPTDGDGSGDANDDSIFF